MGTCVALFLARRRHDVMLFDQASSPLQRASRWNEGKIHLGYLYAADATLETAKRLLPGGLAFASLFEELAGRKLEHVTSDDDIYLVHRDSVVSAEEAEAYFGAVSHLVREHTRAGGYLCDASAAAARPLSRSELEALADPHVIVKGFRVPERSVSTAAAADSLVAALEAEPRIRLRMGERVEGACPATGCDGPWLVNGERFDWVINALWEGRPEVDAAAGLEPEAGWSHRYRVSAFVRTRRHVAAPSAVVAVGPFGDVKNYNGQDFYVSWYPAGLLAEGFDLAPPSPPAHDEALVAARIAEGLGHALPWAKDLFGQAERLAIAGGYVFAQGRGSLSDRQATLHRRDRWGVRRLGRYISIDTGKYSTAPLTASTLVKDITGQK
jgi:hypothetical protein